MERGGGRDESTRDGREKGERREERERERERMKLERTEKGESPALASI